MGRAVGDDVRTLALTVRGSLGSLHCCWCSAGCAPPSLTALTLLVPFSQPAPRTSPPRAPPPWASPSSARRAPTPSGPTTALQWCSGGRGRRSRT